jgi:Tfp pilus assembly protein PilX
MSFKRLFHQLNNRQEGFAMLMALILLLVGSLLIAPTLSYMTTGVRFTTVQNKNMHEYYSAEAGFEDAYWEIVTNDLEIAEGATYTIPSFILNDKTIDVSITNEGFSTHKVTSVATSSDGSTTTVESYLVYLSFYENAITSNGSVNIQPGSTVDGNVMYDGLLDNKGTITGNDFEATLPSWPTAQDLADKYFDDVDFDDDGTADCEYLDATLDVKDYPTATGPDIGPLYRDGDLQIKYTGNTQNFTSKLGGTVYVAGDLDFKQPAKTYTIDLNGHTIFVEGSITFPPSKVNIDGSGCIIAVGDINFQPGVESNPGDFLFIFSVEGTVWFAPQDDFNGSVAGSVDVNLQPDVNLYHDGDPYALGLNFPVTDYEVWASMTWDINQA